ncbi:hypothetical protein ACS0TY_028852 [Phlomoides rotata]
MGARPYTNTSTLLLLLSLISLLTLSNVVEIANLIARIGAQQHRTGSHVKLNQQEMDRWKWSVAADGIFSTKEAYKFQMEQGTGKVNEDRNKAFELLWRSAATRRTQAIIWKVLKQRLPTKESLRRRGIIQENEDITCRLCGKRKKM